MRTILGISLSIAIALALVPVSSMAQTSTSTIQSRLDVIADLTRQIEALKRQLLDLQGKRQESVKDLITIIRQGSRGDAVITLQTLLAADANVYPEGLITGFFGPATARAVKRFQKMHGLSQVGHVGPKTAEKLREFLEKHPLAEVEDNGSNEGNGTDGNKRGKRFCAMVPPGHLIAPGWLKKHRGEKPIVPDCQTLPPGIVKKLNRTGTSTPPIDTTAPIISGLATSNIASTSAMISWNTNELADGKVYYGTLHPVSTTTASMVASSTLASTHIFGLKNLTASTTYYYFVASEDALHNRATSTEQQFTTVH